MFLVSDLNKHIEQLSQQLISHDLRVAVAESCTGGMLAQEFTAKAGSSKWFECGFVTYSNTSKIRCLGVDADVLIEHGAVSAEVAEQMVLGVLDNSEASVSAAITGVAGPDGGTEAKPVGTVYIATAVRGQVTAVEACQFKGGRHEVREQSAEKAIFELINRLNESF